MSRVRSKRIFGPTQITTTLDVVITVGAHETAVLRSLILASRSGSAQVSRVTINGTSASEALLWEYPLAAGAYVELHDIVLSAGDVLRARTSVGNGMVISAYGSLLSGAYGEVES